MEEKLNYWMIVAGGGGKVWSLFKEENIACIDFDSNLSNILDYNNPEELKQGKQRNLFIWKFAHDIKINDYIIATSGFNKIFGIGQCVKTYYFDETKTEFKHCIGVNWLKVDGGWEYQGKKGTRQTINWDRNSERINLYKSILNGTYRKNVEKVVMNKNIDDYLDKLKKSYELGASPKINLESVELEAEDSKIQIDILETKLKSLYDVGKTDYNIDFENYKLLDFVENNESIDFILNSYMKDEIEELRLSLSMAEERKSYSNYDRYMPDLYLGYERVDRNLRGDRYYKDQDLFTIKFSKKLFSTDSEYKLNELEVENLKNDLNEKIRVVNAEKIKLKSEYNELLKLASIGDKKSNIAYKKYLIKENFL